MNSGQFTFFYSNLDVYSQWYPSKFTIDNISFNCAEQWMMYSKALLFKDSDTSKKILLAKKPSLQKALGRTVKNFDQNVWINNAKRIVYAGNYAKFTQNEHLKQQLLATKGCLAEASPTDTIWGIGLKATDKRALDRKLWRGTNWLGDILTQLREDLLLEEKN